MISICDYFIISKNKLETKLPSDNWLKRKNKQLPRVHGIFDVKVFFIPKSNNFIVGRFIISKESSQVRKEENGLVTEELKDVK